MLWLVILVALAINTLAANPASIWQQLQLAENTPVLYDEVVINTIGDGFSIHYYKVYRLDAFNERREETGYYKEETIQVYLKKNDSTYLWIGNIPYALEKKMTSKIEDMVPVDYVVEYLDGKEVAVLYLQSKLLPVMIKKYLNPLDNELIKEEVYHQNRLVQVRERRNIQTNPSLEKMLFEIPKGYKIYTDRHTWERFIVSKFLKPRISFNILYPVWLPINWELADMGINDFATTKMVVYRFFDGKEFYSLFLRPAELTPDDDSGKERTRFFVQYKGNMGVYQLENQDYIITLVGKLQEKDAIKIIDSLTKLNAE